MTSQGISSSYARTALSSDLSCNLPLSSRIERWKRCRLSQSFDHTLDRINVLEGHTGCVNALSWARDGELLLTGGDDTTVRMWRLDPTEQEQEYPFNCTGVLHTGHRANIFNAHMLPYSSRIATVAGDREVRVFDVEASTGPRTNDNHVYSTAQSMVGLLRCHSDRVKRIVTEDSPDMFLTVGEDGDVRQHDLRVPHTCRRRGSSTCPAPLIKMRHELSTLALSPLSSHNFVVAGDSPYGYLFDRRYTGRFIREEWGEVPSPGADDLSLCVRRFGRLPGDRPNQREHVTGARISSYTGHEVLLSYSGDAVYLFSTRDDVSDTQVSQAKSMLETDNKRRKTSEGPTSVPIVEQRPRSDIALEMLLEGTEDIDPFRLLAAARSEEASEDNIDGENGEERDVDDDEEEDDFSEDASHRPGVPIVLPRRRFEGACNVETVKDVNFLGPDDEFVASGSDDGCMFIWKKDSGALHGIYEGDSSVVNVIEMHPHLPLVAVSGIDHTVKLFAPIHGESIFSRMDIADEITQGNLRRSREHRSLTSQMLLGHLFRVAARQGTDCSHQ